MVITRDRYVKKNCQTKLELIYHIFVTRKILGYFILLSSFKRIFCLSRDPLKLLQPKSFWLNFIFLNKTFDISWNNPLKSKFRNCDVYSRDKPRRECVLIVYVKTFVQVIRNIYHTVRVLSSIQTRPCTNFVWSE